MHQHLTVARVAEGLGVAWHTANDAVLAEGKRVLIAHPGRPNDPGRGATGRRWSRWMGLTGFTTAATGGLPDAVAVMGPFHVVGLGGNGLDRCRRRIQRATTGRQGREDDPLHRARPTLRTGAGVLTDKRQDRLEALLAVDARVGGEVAWSVHRRVVAAYRHADRRRGRASMVKPITRSAAERPSRRPRSSPRAGRPRIGPSTRRPASTGPAHPTDRPRRSTADSNTCAAQHSDLETSPTASPDHCSKPADSDPDHTLDCE